MVLAIFKSSIELYKRGHPEVKSIYLRSDCAGAYRNEKVIAGLWSLRNGGIAKDLKINGYFYSEPGKFFAFKFFKRLFFSVIYFCNLDKLHTH